MSHKVRQFSLRHLGFDAGAHMTEEATTWLYLDPISIIVMIDVPVVLSWFFISGSKFFHQVDGIP